MENFGQQTSIWHALLFGQWHFYAGWHYTVDSCCHSWFDLILVVCSAVPADRKASVPSAQVKSRYTQKHGKCQREKLPWNINGMFQVHSLAFERTFLEDSSHWGSVTTRANYRWLLSWLCSHSNVEMGLSLFVWFNSDLFVQKMWYKVIGFKCNT